MQTTDNKKCAIMQFMIAPTFGVWLDKELNVRGMSQAELARQAGVTRAAITNVLANNRGAGTDLCLGIARALKLPPEQVYRAAGLLPPDPEKDPLVEQAEHLLSKLKYKQTRETAIALLNALVLEEEKGTYNANSSGETKETQ